MAYLPQVGKLDREILLGRLRRYELAKQKKFK